MKLLSAFSLGLLSMATVNSPIFLSKENTYFNIDESGNILSLSEGYESLNEYRLYSIYDNSEINEINPHLFDNLTQNFIISISSGIEELDAQMFTNEHILQVNFMGNEEEWNSYSLSLGELPVYYYQCDEGFVHYWNELIRPDESFDICSLTQENYQKLLARYNALESSDRLVVDEYEDVAGAKISATMKYLEEYFKNPSSPSPNKQNLPQDVTIGLIVAIAIFGMTTISVFYVLKKKDIIS